jgi:small-conductance mechanosensitive channel
MTQASWLHTWNGTFAPFLLAPTVFVVWVLSLWLAKRILVRRLRKWASRTSVVWDDMLVDSLSFPLNFLILASGVAVFTQLLELPDKADRIAAIALRACVVFAIVFFADSLLRALLARRESRTALGGLSHGLVKGLVRGFIIGMGALILLDQLGISITPILASLGIGSLAVALALQDTLSNFFAGIYVTIDKPVSVGDFVKLESGQEGYVEEVGWRSTRVRMLANNVVIIPNSKLMSSVITNYYQPSKQLAVVVDLGVHYSSDLEHVERVTVEVAREVLKSTPGAVADFEPFVRFHTFGESSVNFSVIMQAKEFTDNYLIKHHFVKALLARYRREGIVIPSTIRSLGIEPESIRFVKEALSVPSTK